MHLIQEKTTKDDNDQVKQRAQSASKDPRAMRNQETNAESRHWAQFLVAIGAVVLSIGVSWGITQNTLQTFQGQMLEVRAGQKTVNDFLVDLRVSLVKINAQQTRIEETLESRVTSINREMQALREQVQIMQRTIATVWPRLRAHGENISILAKEIERACKCRIELRAPDSF